VNLWIWGNLLEVVKQENLTPLEMIIISRQAAAGMAYLSFKRIVHRDLALRNLLVKTSTSEACRFMVKISDFGLSRMISEENEYYKSKSAALPVKWTAPEALTHGKFSTQSDVWSYGVTIWELYSNGSAPYIGMTNPEVVAFVTGGRHLSSPKDCPEDIFDEMRKCWNLQPEKRPTWEELIAFWEKKIPPEDKPKNLRRSYISNDSFYNGQTKHYGF